MEELVLPLQPLQQLHLIAPLPGSFFAIGVMTSGGEGEVSGLGLSDVEDGDEGVGREAFSQAGEAATGAVTTEEGERTRLSPTVVAAQPRR